MERIITISEANVVKTGVSQKGSWTLSAIKDTQGDSYSTFKDHLRELAGGHIGATAKILYTEKQNGNFTNRTLEGLEILEEASVSPSNGTGDQIQVIPPYQFAQTPNSPDLRQTQIMRQTAAKVAAVIEQAHPSPEFDQQDFIELAEFLLYYFENGPADEVPFGS